MTSVEALLGEGGRGGVAMATLDDGTEVVVKSGEPSAIAAEAAGLRWLAEPGAVGVPEVLGTTEGRMVSTRVPPGRPDGQAAERFGRGLAALHAAGAPAFGSPPPGGPVHAWIGDARMVDETGEHWPSWYAEHRVLPYARQARDQGTFSADDVALVERACARFDEVAGPHEPPARLHGDLWTGNVLWSGGQGWVIDPAAHGGHRETDLAMPRSSARRICRRSWRPTTRPRRWPRGGATGSGCTSSSRCSCTPCSSAVGTGRRRCAPANS